MKRLSRYRRHRFAGPVLLVFALFLIGTTFTVSSASTRTSTNAFARTTAIEEGNRIFLRGCASCHGINAEGGKIAPSLVGVGAAAVDFQVATGRMPLADMSAQARRKKPAYTPDQIAALAAYVSSLAPGPAIPNQVVANFERDGNTAQGGDLFRNNCAMCHNFAGQGGALTSGKFAPSLMNSTPLEMYEAMITGPASMPVFGDKIITPAEKLSIIKWIKAAQNEPNLGGASLGRVGPVTEGLFIWIVGLGLLIGIAVWLATKAR